MNKLYIISLYLFVCAMHASLSSSEKPARLRSVSKESIETVIASISSRSSSPTTTQQQEILPPQIMQREVPVVLSTREVLRQTGQTYIDEIKDCYTNGFYNGCYKFCTQPGTRPDLNPHDQVQDCRSRTDEGCMCIIGWACAGACGYGLTIICPRG